MIATEETSVCKCGAPRASNGLETNKRPQAECPRLKARDSPEDLCPGPQARPASQQFGISGVGRDCLFFFFLNVFLLHTSFCVVWRPPYARSFPLRVPRRGECRRRGAPLDPLPSFASFLC